MMWEWLILGAMCVIAAAGSVWFMRCPAMADTEESPLFRAAQDSGPVWLFEGEILIDMSRAARLLDPAERPVGNWSDLRASLRLRFPGFPETREDPGRALVVDPIEDEDPMEVTCEWLDEMIRVQMNPRRPGHAEPDAAQGVQGLPLSAIDHAPYPAWWLDAGGRLCWENGAHERLRDRVRDGSPAPGEPLFAIAATDPSDGTRMRRALAAGTRELWFDVSVVPHGTGHLCFALDVNAEVEAEAAQRNFVQTLAKTFAHLSIGLAIFDRNRQLVMFNPALTDLTALPVDFLSARPNLLSFFDRLRDQRMMPEPRDYQSWRQQMTDLVAAASDGQYAETWTLPSGSVYSVTGRPHPDGAIAFLFEDISAEITLTRRFRADLELVQSVLDHLDRAIAVFAADGTLGISNTAYRRLWCTDPDECLVPTTITDATRLWQGHCRATPLWGQIRDFAAMRGNRTFWSGDFRLNSGREMICRIHPVDGGATMVTFEPSVLGHRRALPPAEKRIALA
ncbi:PAS-domain containing protein [Pontibaca methylaminivorans]|uniref:PAS fold n=1 Tax=Pontibaca methylaminivorans TaxID=515897 RepID=A0A1R3WRS7_9RHOB|nr:PAS-domain containing protein [Pontibaca methylaminivorans]SIT80989.1 PAS fold [Pontibaca methylaminivorans]